MIMATVTAGPYKGSIVNIETGDTLAGMCHCDLGGDKGTVLIRSTHLRKWISVESIELHNPPLHRTPKTNGSETITITLTKKQLLAGVQKTVYPRCCLPSQAMHGITARLWDYLEELSTEA